MLVDSSEPIKKNLGKMCPERCRNYTSKSKGRTGGGGYFVALKEAFFTFFNASFFTVLIPTCNRCMLAFYTVRSDKCGILSALEKSETILDR